MHDELMLIEENVTWTLNDFPTGKKLIDLKWVYNLKSDAVSNMAKHKVCLIAKAYIQRPGIDFKEFFAWAARLDSSHLLLAVTAQFKWKVHHMDVKTTLLNDELSEEVHVTSLQD